MSKQHILISDKRKDNETFFKYIKNGTFFSYDGTIFFKMSDRQKWNSWNMTTASAAVIHDEINGCVQLECELVIK